MNYNLYSQDIEELTAHLNAGVSPFHTVQYSAELLKGRGFEELKLDAAWFPKAGMGYFVNIFDTTLAAFVIGRDITCLLYTSIRRDSSETVIIEEIDSFFSFSTLT